MSKIILSAMFLCVVTGCTLNIADKRINPAELSLAFKQRDQSATITDKNVLTLSQKLVELNDRITALEKQKGKK